MLVALIAFSAGAYAQGENANSGSSFVFDFGSFTGLAGIVTTIVTQLVKMITALQKAGWKIATAIIVGVAVTYIGYFFNLTPFLLGASILQVLIYGVAAGLAGCGFYDIIKVILKALGLWKDTSEK